MWVLTEERGDGKGRGCGRRWLRRSNKGGRSALGGAQAQKQRSNTTRKTARLSFSVVEQRPGRQESRTLHR